ncbi:hypothetical protein EDB87DRAFT_743349 [Lactarius vividus]|nr:hypothetical protein EDB87DRAFT_743349 [Lactarius vividus]
MHASYVAILVLAASAASPALSAPLAPDPFQSIPTTNSLSSGGLSIADLNNINIVNKPDSPPAPAVGARSTVDDIATKVLQLFSGNIVTRDLGDSFQSVPTNVSSLFGPLGLKDPRLGVALGSRSGGDNGGILLGRDGVDSVREIFRRDCGSLNVGGVTVPQPIGSCDLDSLITDLQNFQRDLASRSLNSLE